MRISRVIVVLSLVAAMAGDAGAQERPNEASRDLGSRPIDVTADRLSADSVRNTVTFEGNVVAKQADVTLYADRIQAGYSRESGSIDRIEAEGNVRFLQEGREARSARATFHNLEQRIVLSGGATLRQGQNTVQGETVTIFLRENRSMVTGGKDGGRVQAVINPKGILETSPK
ncbi:MAG TPA: lipopolysaccharide transport periplasmic protein LptA [Patescibacteria group bacterium]|nr:lipopolysaccharide transport periplasmic protein LptA [Patescibacteria group bacterium]